MIKHQLSSLAVACALAAGSSGTAIAQQLGLDARAPTAKFLEPLKLDLVMRADDPRMPQFCAAKGVRCPTVVSGGRIPGGLGAPDDFGTGYRNVLISLHVQQITNTPVANGGANADGSLFVNWLTSSAAADVEAGGPYMWVVPPPGEVLLRLHGVLEPERARDLRRDQAQRVRRARQLSDRPRGPDRRLPGRVRSIRRQRRDDRRHRLLQLELHRPRGGRRRRRVRFRFEGIAVALCSGLSTL